MSTIDIARDLADQVLFRHAAGVDAGNSIPAAHLDLLASHGFYGLEASDLEPPERWRVMELLASGCLATAFVLIQHQGAVRAVTEADADVRSRWRRPLLAGERRDGIAISAVRRQAPTLRATETSDGWRVSGSVPWMTGWGMIDVFLLGAATDDDREVWALVDAVETVHVRAQLIDLAAANASQTVELDIDGLVVPPDRVIGVSPRTPWDPDDGGGRGNGSMALGVARRACMLMGSSPFDARLDEVRLTLDSAGDASMAAARAAASDLAMQAAWRLVIDHGSRSIIAHQHGQRLVREAAFTGVFGTRPAIRSALLDTIDRR